MKQAVILKSFPNGINVIMDEELPFEALLEEIGERFRDSAGFFKSAKIALSLEGRILTEEEENEIVRVIQENSEVTVLCVVKKQGELQEYFARTLQQVERRISESEDDGQIYRGTLQDGQILETENTIILLGDVEEGAMVVSKKNVIVFGNLLGEVFAGTEEAEGHFVAALSMAPKRIKIGSMRCDEKARKEKWWSRQKNASAKIAYIKDKKVVIEPITKEMISAMFGTYRSDT